MTTLASCHWGPARPDDNPASRTVRTRPGVQRPETSTTSQKLLNGPRCPALSNPERLSNGVISRSQELNVDHGGAI